MAKRQLLRQYSGLLFFDPLPPDKIRQLEQLASKVGLTAEVCPTSLEFEFQGRDTNRFVVSLLAEFAHVVRDAEGEIECEEEDDSGEDRVFEFYSFRGGKLYRQRGVIVREAEELVAPGPADGGTVST